MNFSGLITGFIIAFTFWILSTNEKQNMSNELDHLEIVQNFDFKTEDDHYSIYKIEKDNLCFVYNNFQTDSKERLVEIDYKTNYINDTIVSTLDEIKTWIENRKIIFINKKNL